MRSTCLERIAAWRRVPCPGGCGVMVSGICAMRDGTWMCGRHPCWVELSGSDDPQVLELADDPHNFGPMAALCLHLGAWGRRVERLTALLFPEPPADEGHLRRHRLAMARGVVWAVHARAQGQPLPEVQ